jgi:hypothetical protein
LIQGWGFPDHLLGTKMKKTIIALMLVSVSAGAMADGYDRYNNYNNNDAWIPAAILGGTAVLSAVIAQPQQVIIQQPVYQAPVYQQQPAWQASGYPPPGYYYNNYCNCYTFQGR